MEDTKKVDAEIYSEILDSLGDAVRGTDEAYGIAVATWGKTDKRSEDLLKTWGEVETAFRQFEGMVPK